MESFVCEPQMKILLSGCSGAGKTTAGKQLADRGWTHFDCEYEYSQNSDWLQNPVPYMPEGKNVVASWGYAPDHMVKVQAILEHGYKPVWLCGPTPYLEDARRFRGDDPEFILESRKDRFHITEYPMYPDMVLNAFRPNGSRWDVAALLHDVYWTD